MKKKLSNILLVEDDEVDIAIVKKAFEKNRIFNPLFIASNGEEAIQKLRGDQGHEKIPLPKILLLDLNMPRMGGIEFLKELRKDQELSSISVFIMTTSNQDNDKIEAYKLNVAGYILKPLAFDNFVNIVSVLKRYWELCE